MSQVAAGKMLTLCAQSSITCWTERVLRAMVADRSRDSYKLVRDRMHPTVNRDATYMLFAQLPMDGAPKFTFEYPY